VRHRRGRARQRFGAAEADREMGDLERANNLATKAQLLSAELVKK